MLVWYDATETHPCPVAIPLPGLGTPLLRSINFRAAMFPFNCSKFLSFFGQIFVVLDLRRLGLEFLLHAPGQPPPYLQSTHPGSDVMMFPTSALLWALPLLSSPSLPAAPVLMALGLP